MNEQNEQRLQTVEQLEEQLNNLEEDEDYQIKKSLANSVVGIGQQFMQCYWQQMVLTSLIP